MTEQIETLLKAAKILSRYAGSEAAYATSLLEDLAGQIELGALAPASEEK